MCFTVAKVFLYAFLAILFLTAVPSRADTGSLTGYGYEVLLAKLDYLQQKLIEMDFSMKEDREVVSEKQTQLENLSDGLLWAINQMSHNLTALQAQSMKILSQQKACASHEQMRREIQQLAPKDYKAGLSLLRLSDANGTVSNHQSVKSLRSCYGQHTTQSGKYLIQPSENYEPFMVYCEQQRFGGGWLVIQVRLDGSENFYRNWSEYRKGFGSIDGEFWIGLEHLHQLTKERPHELLVELEDFNGNYVYARYKEFEVGSEAEHYQLKKVGAYSGTAGDSLTYHKGMKFSTMDRDNDENGANCAIKYTGAWWYKECHYANLNGAYKNGEDAKAINWYHYTNKHLGMAYSRMMIREVE